VIIHLTARIQIELARTAELSPVFRWQFGDSGALRSGVFMTHGPHHL
jgi:hypothetical protein